MSEETPGAPWAMQLVARIEKVEPPTTAAVCAASALATIALVEDDRSEIGGPWRPALDAWQGGGRIRKLVRRARGAAWTRAQEPDGASAVAGSAEVRAYVPSPMDAVPAAVAKLQIQSTPLDEPERIRVLPARPASSGVAMIAVTPEVEMSWGKQAAQCAHAGQLLWNHWSAADRTRWRDRGAPVQVLHPDVDLWQQLLAQAAVVVRDGGFTEVAPGTRTAVALEWPSAG